MKKIINYFKWKDVGIEHINSHTKYLCYTK